MEAQTAYDTMKVVPSGAYVAATIGGLSLNEWAAVAALVYSVAMLVFLIWDRGIKPWRAAQVRARKAEARRKRRKAVVRVIEHREAVSEAGE